MFDKVTEIVAHMIGVFHIAIEEARMRDVYAQFQAAKLEDPAVEDLLNISVKISAPYTLTDFSPSVEYTPSAADYFFAPDGYGLYLADLFYQPLGQLALIEGSPDGQAAPLPFFPVRPHLTLEPPGSVATITAQVAWMEDDDELYLNEEQAEFVDPSAYLTSLHSLALISKALGATKAFLSGSMMSSTTISQSWANASASPSRPLAASRTLKPWVVRYCDSSSLSSSSSSTSSTRFCISVSLLLPGNSLTRRPGTADGQAFAFTEPLHQPDTN